MKAYLDTNILVRHFTGDPPTQARAATELLASATDLRLTDVVAAETVYVMESFYRRPPAEVAMLLRAVAAFPAVRSQDDDRLLRALELHELHRIDFTACYLAACAERSPDRQVASFDHDLEQGREHHPVAAERPSVRRPSALSGNERVTASGEDPLNRSAVCWGPRRPRDLGGSLLCTASYSDGMIS